MVQIDLDLNVDKAVGELSKLSKVSKSIGKELSKNITAGFKSIESSVSSMANRIKGLLATVGLAAFAKQAIEAASDLEEVQNVVDVTFGNAAKTIDDWAKTVGDSFGLTELQAKQFAGNFGAAFKALGLAIPDVIKLSENMAQLSADVASFYNLSADEAKTKLFGGVISGETEGLKSLGIVMTQTNLDAYLMSQGITTSYKSLDAATQATIRYNFVMTQLADAQGDFSRTSGSWANQVKQLENNFIAVSATIGTLLKNYLLPFIQALNIGLKYILGWVQGIGALAGLDVEISESTGSISEFGDVGTDALESLTDNTDDATEAQNALNKAQQKGLASVHKLNKISSSKSAGTSGSGAGSLAGLDIKPLDYANIGKAVLKVEGPLGELLELMKDGQWELAGRRVATSINNVADSLYNLLTKKATTEGIKKFNTNFANFSNGLLDINFKKIGNTIGAGTNLIASSFNDLYDKLVARDIFKNLGKKIADLLYGTVTEINWTELGKALSLKFAAAIQIFVGFVEEAKNGDLGNKIGNALKDLIIGAIDNVKTSAKDLGEAIGNFINLGLQGISSFLGNGNTLGAVAEALVNTINAAVNTISTQDITNALSGIFRTIGQVFTNLSNIDFDALTSTLADGISDAASNGSLSEAVAGLTKFVLALVNALAQLIVKTDWLEVGKAILEGIASAITDNPAGAALLAGAIATHIVGKAGISLLTSEIAAAAGAGSFTSIGTLIGNALGLAAGAALAYGVVKETEGIFTKIDLFQYDLTNVKTFQAEVKKIEDQVVDTTTVFTKLFNADGMYEYTKGLNDLRTKLTSLSTDLDKGKLTKQKLIDFTETLKDMGYQSEALDKLTIAAQNFDKTNAEAIKNATQAFNALNLEVYDNATKLEKLDDAYTEANSTTKKNIDEMLQSWGTYEAGFTRTIDSVSADISTMSSNTTQSLDELSQDIQTTLDTLPSDAKAAGENLAEGISEGVQNKQSSVLAKLGAFAGSLIDKAKNVLGIHSPSRVFAELGSYIDQGLMQGIDNDADLAIGSIETLASDMTDSFDIKPENSLSLLENKTASICESMTESFNRVTDSIFAATDALKGIRANDYVPNLGSNVSIMTPISGDSSMDRITAELAYLRDSITKLSNKKDNLSVPIYIDGVLTEEKFINLQDNVRYRTNGALA